MPIQINTALLVVTLNIKRYIKPITITFKRFLCIICDERKLKNIRPVYKKRNAGSLKRNL
jgi:hypothetical protein